MAPGSPAALGAPVRRRSSSEHHVRCDSAPPRARARGFIRLHSLSTQERYGSLPYKTLIKCLPLDLRASFPGEMPPMDDRILVIVVAVVVLLALEIIVLIVAAGGDFGKLGLAWLALRRAARDPDFAAKLTTMLEPTTAQAPARPSGVPLRLLALLQREGRLLDFLMEDIHSYPDAQIGAAVRDIHRQCQAAVHEHLDLQPVIDKPEGSAVEVSAGFDPSAIRLVGNVTGQPPFRGTLQHHGWRVKDINLAPPPEGQDELVLMPAEVELP